MSESYLITALEMPAGTPVAEGIQSACRKAGLKIDQIDEIHLYSDAPSTLFTRNQSVGSREIFSWPHLPLFTASGMQSMCRALEVGDLSIGLLVEATELGTGVIILANPKAVGRHNIAPIALLANRLGHVTSSGSLTEIAFKTLACAPVEIEPEEPVIDLRMPKKNPPRPWLAIHATDIPDIPEWPKDRLLVSQTLAGSLGQIALAMSKSKTDPGVWISTITNGPVLSTLVLPL